MKFPVSLVVFVLSVGIGASVTRGAPGGACCLPDGSCEVISIGDCDERCGTFYGFKSECVACGYWLCGGTCPPGESCKYPWECGPVPRPCPPRGDDPLPEFAVHPSGDELDEEADPVIESWGGDRDGDPDDRVVMAHIANPTFSVEAVEINGVDVGFRPTSSVATRPGDIITVEIFVRDWSPAGQRLRGYQSQVDFGSYTSGDAGDIYPQAFSETTDRYGKCTAGGPDGDPNDENVYIDHARCSEDSDPGGSDLGPWSNGGCSVPVDCLDPPEGSGLCSSPSIDWVFGSVARTVAVTNSIMCDHRHVGATMVSDQGPICNQDGSKYYLGTLILEVSVDAEGVFTVSLDDRDLDDDGIPDFCLLADEDNTLIVPVYFESLTIRVR